MPIAEIAQRYLREAIRLSIENVESGQGGPFGAIVVYQGEIIGRGTNLVTATNDPTAHAEVVAIRRACQHRQSFMLDDCEIYTSCEPCPLCLAAIYWSRMTKIYYAATCDDAAAAGFDDRIFYEELAKPIESRQIPAVHLLREEASAAFAAWMRSSGRIDY
ncbi:MAG: nucleoside deaminase [Planctomycetaceae bacterium]|nr:nucleoside deaminase [Planctomycetaceae bacterium]